MLFARRCSFAFLSRWARFPWNWSTEQRNAHRILFADAAGAVAGEPELAVLVVRESDGLPGQGWWTGGRPMREGYEGAWTGPDAAAFVRGLQARAFDYWQVGS